MKCYLLILSEAYPMPPKKQAKAKPEPEPTRASRSKSATKPTESKARKSKSVPPTESKSKTVKKSVTDTESDHKLQFEFGEFIAFIDKEDIQSGEQKISIGRVSARLGFNSMSAGEQGSRE